MKTHPSDTQHDLRPIGVFDSGVGGLTVLRSLMAAMPGEEFIYLGDTARVPYGTKSSDTIKTYSASLARVLLQHNVKMIVIACNTASAHATDIVRDLAAPLPVMDVIGPAAQAAAKATRNKNILVMGTQSTIQSGSYTNALAAIDKSITVQGVAAQLLVAMAEEGWTSGPIAESVIREYLAPILAQDQKPDTIILGCTHFPLLKETIASVVGPDVTLIDSGEAVALALNHPASTQTESRMSFMVTDSVERFAPVAARFLGRTIPASAITHIDLTTFDNLISTRHSAGAYS